MKIKRFNESIDQNLKSEILSLLTDITDEYDSLIVTATKNPSRSYLDIRIKGFNKIFQEIEDYDTLEFFKFKKDVTNLIINTAIRIEETLGVKVNLENVYSIGGEVPMIPDNITNWVYFKVYI
jgi:hypothetical protein